MATERRSNLRAACAYDGTPRPADMADWLLASFRIPSDEAYTLICRACGRSLGRVYGEKARAARAAGAQIMPSAR